jgi:hypothetical protein
MQDDRTGEQATTSAGSPPRPQAFASAESLRDTTTDVGDDSLPPSGSSEAVGHAKNLGMCHRMGVRIVSRYPEPAVVRSCPR